MLYKVTYEGDSIYEAYRNAVSNKELNEFYKKFKWMNPRFVHEHSDWRLYFTEKGYVEFRESILPEITKVLDEDKIEIEQVSENVYPSDQIVYEDEYQRVYDVQGSNILSEEYLQTLQEVYFGKTAPIEEMESLINELRNRYMKINRVPKNDPILNSFNELVMKFFGLGAFALKVSFDPVPAISSIPITYNSKIAFADSYVVDPDSYRFKKEAEYTCIINITTGLIFSDCFTTEEVMAAILYELGYMFFGCFSASNALLANVKTATSIATAIAGTIQNIFYAKYIADNFTSSLSALKQPTPNSIETFVNNLPEEIQQQIRPQMKAMTPEQLAAALKSAQKGIKDMNDNIDSITDKVKIAKNVGIAVIIANAITGSKAYKWFIGAFKSDFIKNSGVRSVVVGFANYVRIGIKHGTRLINGIGSYILKKFTNTSSGSAIRDLGIYDMIMPYRKVINIAKNPINWISMLINYKADLAAGNFPTMYGYGAAEVSYFQKMQSNNKVGLVKHFLKSCPWMGVVFDVAMLPARILNGVFDHSPNGVARCMDQIRMLEAELTKQDLPATMYSRISQDLAACKQTLSKLIDISNGVRDPDILQKLYNKLLIDCLGSVGLKDKLFNDSSRFSEWDHETTAKMNA